MNLSDLALPFPAEDVEWRVSRSGMGQKGIFCFVLAYVTARAIQSRLDEVVWPENWKLEEPKVLSVNGKSAFAVGISIRDARGSAPREWITKWDVSEPTNIEPAKGGFSGAMKRAGSQWGIGRYLYRLDETFAETSDVRVTGSRGWNYAKLPDKAGGASYYWKTPTLPGWALPKEPEHEISPDELNELKKEWKAKFMPDSKSPSDLREGFAQFAGDFPSSDHTCWTRDAFEKCVAKIQTVSNSGGPDSDVPFGG